MKNHPHTKEEIRKKKQKFWAVINLLYRQNEFLWYSKCLNVVKYLLIDQLSLKVSAAKKGWDMGILFLSACI